MSGRGPILSKETLRDVRRPSVDAVIVREWEAGFTEGLGRPVFYTCREGEHVHFDARQQLIVFWKDDDLPDAAARLKATIRVTIPDAILDDPAGEVEKI